MIDLHRIPNSEPASYRLQITDLTQL